MCHGLNKERRLDRPQAIHQAGSLSATAHPRARSCRASPGLEEPLCCPASPAPGQGLESGPSSLGRVTVSPSLAAVPVPHPTPARRLSSGAMVSVPGTPRPGGDRGEPASSEGREELGSPRLPSSASFSRWLAASPGAGGSPLRLVGWGGMAASAWLEAGLARVLFYPTLLYTVFRGRVRGPAHRDWYHRIDHTVLLGALPLRSMTRRVREAAGPGRAGSGPRASASAPRPSLSPLFASAAGTGRERARGDHHERRVRD